MKRAPIKKKNKLKIVYHTDGPMVLKSAYNKLRRERDRLKIELARALDALASAVIDGIPND